MFGKHKRRKKEVVAPVSGEIVPLSQVPDEVFSSGIMGKGIAIIPSDNFVVAPCDGKVVVLPDTLHAIGIQCNNGLEILIHIGIDTVYTKGEGFQSMVKEGDKVIKGSPLMSVDFGYLKKQNLPIVTPVVVLNSKEVPFRLVESGSCLAGVTEIIEMQ